MRPERAVGEGEAPRIRYAIDVRVYYEDTDALGIVYHANYLKYMERCRSEWLHAKGCDVEQLREHAGILFTVYRAALEYHAPARLWDTLRVSVAIAMLGKVTLDLEQSVERGDQLLCQGTLRLASLDAGTRKPKPMPANLMRLIGQPTP